MKSIQRNRAGMIMVEFAITVPILILIIFGSTQIANALYTQQYLTEVTYHAALQGMSPFSNETNIEDTIEDMLNSRGIDINEANVSVTGTDGTTSFELLPVGSPFLVSIWVDPETTYGGPAFTDILRIGAVSSGIKQ